ncbi:hypothetical protein PSN45_002102 [Yamadazyma tenuis]|uniref:uncharacterized protein n=1 Tax=Candida tenuis TaxID=2315449 RepID=UPI00279F297D|nr:hypothetical protein PSN45_002102 [Yamadazyma tenuis]
MSRSVRNITACKWCRTKRIKCDKQFPKCGNCSRKGLECVSIDPGTGETVSRSYVYDLEKQIDLLKHQVRLLQQGGKATAKSMVSPTLPVSESKPPPPPEEPINSSVKNGSSSGYINYKVLSLRDEDVKKFKSIPDDELPPVSVYEEAVVLYFKISNIQLPILHREHFLSHYFKPLYGQESPQLRSRLLGMKDTIPVPQRNVSATSDPVKRRKCLFFMNIILAISTSIQQRQYALSLSNHYQQQSFKYADAFWNTSDPQTATDLGKLEMIQSLLLLSAYSLMRPSNPGAWYLIGNTIRLLYDLNLHEDPELTSSDPFIIDLKRRIFWSCYSLDRQISMYFKKPFGMVSRFDIQLPSSADDSYLCGIYLDISQVHQYDSGDKKITIHYIKLRILQDQIAVSTADMDGRQVLESKLVQWYSEAQAIISSEFNEFNQLIFKLNYFQSIVNIYKFLLFEPQLKPDLPQFNRILSASTEIIFSYEALQNRLRLLNYSWVSVNNIFLSAITYLYVIYVVEPIRATVRLPELDHVVTTATEFLQRLEPICFNQCTACSNNIKSMRDNVAEMFEKQTVPESDILDHDVLFDNSEFVNSMVGSVNSLEMEKDIKKQKIATECVCAKKSTCSCGAKPALQCSCSKAATENVAPAAGDACSCGKRAKKACTCGAAGDCAREGETDFTNLK